MRMNALIPLQGKAADPIGSMARGQQLAHRNALMPLEIEAAEQGIQQNALNMDATRQNMDLRRQANARAQAQQSAAMGDRQKAEAIRAEAADYLRVLQAGDEQAFEALNQKYGNAELQGQFGNPKVAQSIQMLYADPMDALAVMADQAQPPKADWKVNEATGQAYNAANPSQPAVNIPNWQTPKEKPDFGDEANLRKEFNGLPTVKAFREQATAYGRIVASANDPSPAGDLALIFNYMKVLDPGSVVRESEFATAESAAAWLQKQEESGLTVPLPVARAIRRAVSGQRLSAEQRADFVGRGEALYKNAENQYNIISDQYTAIAEGQGVDPTRAIVDFRYAPVESEVVAPPPAPGSPQIELTPELMSIYEKYSQAGAGQ